ncbi:MAG TPA: thiol reductant ABC exporter subunit CydC, partial [Streptosporangiaceae bacterium]
MSGTRESPGGGPVGGALTSGGGGPVNGPARHPLLRLLRLARPLRVQLLFAVLAGAAATGCGVALLAVSGFLLARASLHPSIVAI